MNNNIEHEKKGWFRLIKVLFVIICIISFIPIISAFISYRPIFDRDISRYSIKCEDGRVRGDFNGEDLYFDSGVTFVSPFSRYSINSEQDNYRNDWAKFACANQESGDELVKKFDSRKDLIPEKINYTIVMTKEGYEGSWSEAIGYSLLALLVYIVSLSLLRAIFLYVVFGERFWWNLLAIVRWFRK